MPLAIWWVRRDLRLNDNPALQAALAGGYAVLPLFIRDPYFAASAGSRRAAFLWAGLHALDAALRQRGSRLVLRSGPPAGVLAQLLAETGATAVFAGEDFSPYARRRDAAVDRTLPRPLQLVLDVSAQHPTAVTKPDGSPYTVFTPFSKAWKALPLAESAPWSPPARLPQIPPVTSEDLPPVPPQQADVLARFPAGEQEAARRLDAFLAGPVLAYAAARDRLDLEGTSALSPYLRFGMLSPRRAALRARGLLAAYQADPEARRGVEVWLNELIWREFYLAILYHFPNVLREAFNPGLRAVPWRSAPAELEAWQQGRTGYPVVDACMRQLNTTGWMHNRGRMIVASFLAKDLFLNWHEGERWFMRQLLDGDPAANNGGWQWTAGVGTDAAPYFRIFNPVLQGKKFDPAGAFVRHWVPELAHLPADLIHEPWRAPQPPRGYPAPIVDHAAARQRALAGYRKPAAGSQV